MNLKENCWVEINENMFLNRLFKYKIYKEKSLKRRKRKRTLSGDYMETLSRNIQTIDASTDRDIKKLKTFVEYELGEITERLETISKSDKRHAKINEKIEKLKTTIAEFEINIASIEVNDVNVKKKLESVSTRINSISKLAASLEK